MFDKIISEQNLFASWKEFLKGKKKRQDVQVFSVELEENIFSLQVDLAAGLYKHGGYVSFFVRDPKLRLIHKASVRDRLMHHAIHRALYPYFDKQFIYDTYSSRLGKGVHAAINRFRLFAWKISRNKTRLVWVLKVDIKKFFPSINQTLLLEILERKLPQDGRLMTLLGEVIKSYKASSGQGLPLGNLTSQLFSNVYLNSLDQFAKRSLCLNYYIRYADDIFILSADKKQLEMAYKELVDFLKDQLHLYFHSNKTHLELWHKGVDILGYVSFPNKTILRPATAVRMLKRLQNSSRAEVDVRINDLYSRIKFERK